MFISQQNYLNWQRKLTTNKMFRLFWVWWGIYSVTLVFAASIYLLFFPPGRRAVLFASITFVFARFVVCNIIRFFYKKVRPYQRWNFLPPSSRFMSLPHEREDSFPSQHTSALSAVATAIFLFYPGIGLGLFGLAMIVGMARIILGYHYVSDILAGLVLGVMSGYFIYWLLNSRLFT